MGGYGAFIILVGVLLFVGILCGGPLPDPTDDGDDGLEEWMLTEADDNEW